MSALRLLTLNVWGLPWPLSREPEVRVRELGARLADTDADLVALQEVWVPEYRGSLVTAGRAAGFEHLWHNVSARSGSGMLVLSRRPFRARFEGFRLNGLPQRVDELDYWGGKGFVALDLETERGPLTVVATHLHARYAAPEDADEHVAHRAAQVLQLATFLADVEQPVVAVGDFNFAPDDAEHRILCGLTGLEDVAARLGRPEPTLCSTNPYRDDEPDERVDYVFARGVRVRALGKALHEPFDIDDRQGACSDHFGLACHVELNGRRPPRYRPDPEALRTCAALIEQGRAVAEGRRDQQRVQAVGLATGAGALAFTRSRWSRRRWLKWSLGALPGLGLAASGLSVMLSEGFAPGELAGYDAARRELEWLRRRA